VIVTDPLGNFTGHLTGNLAYPRLFVLIVIVAVQVTSSSTVCRCCACPLPHEATLSKFHGVVDISPCNDLKTTLKQKVECVTQDGDEIDSFADVNLSTFFEPPQIMNHAFPFTSGRREYHLCTMEENNRNKKPMVVV